MKKRFVLGLALLVSQFYIGQTTRITYISHKRDTLILPDNDLGKHIYKAWEYAPKSEKRPIIQFATEKKIKSLNQKLYTSRQKKNVRNSLANN